MKKKLYGLIITALSIAAIGVPAFAAGSISVSGDKTDANVGDTYTVNVTVNNDEGAAVAPEVSVTYDINRLSFVSCSGEYGGGAGGLVTLGEGEYAIAFNVLSGGTASVDVNAIFDGDGSTAQSQSAALNVAGEDTAALYTGANDSGLGIEPSSVMAPDGKIIAAVFPDEIMPAGFIKTTVSYEEQMVEAAQFALGNIYLVYMTDENGNSGTFKMYDQATGALSDFLEITSIENRFIIVLSAGADIAVPDNFQKAQLNWNDKQLEAYAYVGETPAQTSLNMGDFILLYAISSEGYTGWYLYDQNEGTYQRYIYGLAGTNKPASDDGVLSQISSAVESDDEGGVNVMLIILIALAVLMVALIVTVIIMAVKLKEFYSYDYIDEDEDSYENPLFAQAAQLSPERSQSLAQNNNSGMEYYPNAKHAQSAAEQNDTGDFPNAKLAQSATETGANMGIGDRPLSPNNDIGDRPLSHERLQSNPVNNDMNNNPADDIPDEFIVRKKQKSADDANAKYDQNAGAFGGAVMNAGAGAFGGAAMNQSAGAFGGAEYLNDDDIFSPRERSTVSGREDRKARKAEEKARKKEAKRLKKEFGEFGPVDWQSWQNAVEGGEKTAASATASRRNTEEMPNEHQMQQPEEPVHQPGTKARPMEEEVRQVRPERMGVDEGAVRRPAEKSVNPMAGMRVQAEKPVDPMAGMRVQAEEPRRTAPEIKKPIPEMVTSAEEVRKPAEKPVDPMAGMRTPADAAKSNPLDMMRGLPANDSKEPVQGKPVQQFDFDDDFEFEFLDLDDDE